MTQDQNPEEPPELADSDQYTEGDGARDAFPVQVTSALRYAAENKYEYGPRLRNTDIDWDVDGVSSMEGDISRVFLNYRPSKSFSGASGSEYLDVDASGSVLARHQLRLPKQDLPVFLIGLTVVSLVALVVVQVILWANPFEGGPDPYVAGRILWLRAEKPKAQPYITYDAPSTAGVLNRWAIAPAGDGTDLVIVQATLINNTSGAVNMVVDRDAAELRIRGSISLRPVDILDVSYTVEGGEDRYYSPDFKGMWGSVRLNQGEQITGHLVFEAPQGSEFSEFRWLSGDTAVVRY